MNRQDALNPKNRTAPPKKTGGESQAPSESWGGVMASAQAALDKKAENLRVLNVNSLSGFTDYFLICNGQSDRQVRAIADAIEKQLREREERAKPKAIEGYADGRWILMDYGDWVVHIFLDPLREYYDLDGLWAHAPNVPLPKELFHPAGTPLNS